MSLEPSLNLFFGLPTGGTPVTSEKVLREKIATGGGVWRYYGVRPEIAFKSIPPELFSKVELSGKMGIYLPEAGVKDALGMTVEGCVKFKPYSSFSFMPCMTYTNGKDPLSFLTISQPRWVAGVEVEINPFLPLRSKYFSSSSIAH